MSLHRIRRAQIGQETLDILTRGSYRNASGETVEIASQVEAARRGTVAFAPEASAPAFANLGHATTYEVGNETTLDAGRRLLEGGFNPVALNFASARNPGGGFLSGAQAQEEALARASGLYACLKGQGFYAYHKGKDGLYSSYALYSPDVPVFRDEAGALLPAPWPLSMMTSAAPNAKALPPTDRTRILVAFEERIRRVLAIGAHFEHDAIVLGAWGCGAFGNEARQIAPLFGRIVREEFGGAFKRVTFAVLDTSADRRMISPFGQEFARAE